MSDDDRCATLYYDGHCPLCLKEVAKLRRLGDDSLSLTDIHAVAGQADIPDTDTLLRDLHFRTADNRLLVGVEANVAVWQHTRYGYLFRWLNWPVIRPLADRVYRQWAAWRYRRLYGEQYKEAEHASRQP